MIRITSALGWPAPVVTIARVLPNAARLDCNAVGSIAALAVYAIPLPS